MDGVSSLGVKPSPSWMYCQLVPSGAGRMRQLHTAAPTASNATTQGASARARLRRAGRAAAARATAIGTVASPGRLSASPNCAAVENRSAGSFDSAVSTAASTCGGTVFRCSVSERGSSVITRAKMACAVGPVNGGSPVSIS